MSELTDYAAYSPSKSAKQTKLQTLEAGLFPFYHLVLNIV